ncbi:MAG: hypothetical protein PQJ50_12780 [Spirochaetales bacterium]|nr:hypothetical protein [Spirochaetales bacterium]
MQKVETIQASFSSCPEIFVLSLKDFIKLFSDVTNLVFKKKDSHLGGEIFFLPKDGFVYKAKTEGYKTIQDFIDSNNAGFHSEAEYQQYLKSEAESPEEFHDLRADGFFTVSSKDDFYNNGFDQVFQKLDSIKSDNHERSNKISLYQVKTRGDLLQFAHSKKIEEGEEIEKYILSDFESSQKWKLAQKGGFDSESDYEEAQKCGFSNKIAFDSARMLGIQKYSEFQKYLEKSQITNDKGFLTFEYIYLVSGYENNSLPNRLRSIYYLIISSYRRDFGNSVVFSDDIADLSSYAELYDLLKKEIFFADLFGTVDGFFSRPPSGFPTKAVIDASNVCYADQKEGSSVKPKAEYLIRMKEMLEIYGFKDLLFIADANLPHIVEDPEFLEELDRLGILQYSHNEKADKFLLEYTDPNTVVISNDQFRDWDKGNDIHRMGFCYDRKLGLDLL